ncbi:hypothetical protein GCM10027047_37220 [Rhodococcus aerolatus]
MLVVLVAAVAVVWTKVLESGAREVVPTACPAPSPASAAPGAAVSPTPVPTPPGQVIDPAQLDAVAPLPPSQVFVRVLNANGQRGQAATVSADLTDYGFTPAPVDPAANDTVYTSQNMACVGQIRFGPTGAAAARTLGLAVPCAELVQDTRPDGGVDLALGTAFADLKPNAAAVAALTALGQPGGTATTDQLTQARSGTC